MDFTGGFFLLSFYFNDRFYQFWAFETKKCGKWESAKIRWWKLIAKIDWSEENINYVKEKRKLGRFPIDKKMFDYYWWSWSIKN